MLDEDLKAKKSLIDVRELSKTYSSAGCSLSCCRGKKRSQDSTDALMKTSFEVKEHECFSLLGENGAGKSTAFKILTKEERRTAGTV